MGASGLQGSFFQPSCFEWNAPIKVLSHCCWCCPETTALRTLKKAFKVPHVEITGKRTGGQRCVSMPNYVPKLDARQNHEQPQLQACLIPNNTARFPLPGLWISQNLALAAIFNVVAVKWSTQISSRKKPQPCPTAAQRGLLILFSGGAGLHSCLSAGTHLVVVMWSQVQVVGSPLLASQLGWLFLHASPRSSWRCRKGHWGQDDLVCLWFHPLQLWGRFSKQTTCPLQDGTRELAMSHLFLVFMVDSLASTFQRC